MCICLANLKFIFRIAPISGCVLFHFINCTRFAQQIILDSTQVQAGSGTCALSRITRGDCYCYCCWWGSAALTPPPTLPHPPNPTILPCHPPCAGDVIMELGFRSFSKLDMIISQPVIPHNWRRILFVYGFRAFHPLNYSLTYVLNSLTRYALYKQRRSRLRVVLQ